LQKIKKILILFIKKHWHILLAAAVGLLAARILIMSGLLK